METSNNKSKGRKKGGTNQSKIVRVAMTNTEWSMILMALRASSSSPSPMDVLTNKIDNQVSKVLIERQTLAERKALDE